MATTKEARNEVLLQTFIRKQLRLKAHTVAAIEESDTEMIVQIERLGSRRLRCSRCGRSCRRVHSRAVKQRSWRDLPLRKARLVLRYRASAGQVRALRSAHGSVALGRAVGAGERRTGRIGGGPDEASELARSRPSFRPELEKRGGHRPTRGRLWAGATAAQAAALDWRRRGQPPQGASLPHGGLRSGAAYAGVGLAKTAGEQTLRKFFCELGRRRCRPIQGGADGHVGPLCQGGARERAAGPSAVDRFHLVQHLNRAVDEVRRAQLRRLSRKRR